MPLTAHTTAVDAASRRTDVAADTHAAKLNELYELTGRWERTAAALPVITDRLHALKTLHEDAAGIAAAVRQLEADRAQLGTLLAANAQLLGQVFLFLLFV